MISMRCNSGACERPNCSRKVLDQPKLLGGARSAANRPPVGKRTGIKEALRKAGKAGRPARLQPGEIEALKTALKEGPGAHGFATELWTSERVARVIQSRFGVKYHPDHVCRLLGQIGWSCQRPTTRALQRNEAAIAKWKRSDWPRLKKKP